MYTRLLDGMKLDPVRELLALSLHAPDMPAFMVAELQFMHDALSDRKRKFSEIAGEWEGMVERLSVAVRAEPSLSEGDISHLLRSIVLAGNARAATGNGELTAAGLSYEDAASEFALVDGAWVREFLGKKLELSPMGEESGSGGAGVGQEAGRVNIDGFLELALMILQSARGCTPAGLLDSAADCYWAADEYGEARRCYEEGINKLRAAVDWESEDVSGQFYKYYCHLRLSLADLLTERFDEWETVQSLYKDVSEACFFSRAAHSDEDYLAISYLVSDDRLGEFGEPEWAPHVEESKRFENGHVVPLKAQASHVLRLKAVLGERALACLKAEFEENEEGFPVPETHRFMYRLSDLYVQLGDYEKCVNLFGNTSFDDRFMEWSNETLFETEPWVLAYILWLGNYDLARGVTRQLDYKTFKEFADELRAQNEESRRIIQSQGLVGARTLHLVENLDVKPIIDQVRQKLRRENPWIDEAANAGSIFNGEALFRELDKMNWGEVVIAYWNAIEEELKQPSLFGYLWKAAKAQTLPSKYEDPVTCIAQVAKGAPAWKEWWKDNLRQGNFEEGSWFLEEELPSRLSELKWLRNPSAHGKMSERDRAISARQIVLGTGSQSGLLRQLVDIRLSREAGTGRPSWDGSRGGTRRDGLSLSQGRRAVLRRVTRPLSSSNTPATRRGTR